MNIDDLLRIAMERRASDLHLKVGNYPHLRIDGELFPLTDHPRVSAEDMLTMAFSMMSARQKQKFKETTELDMAYGVAGLGRFRVNVFQQRGDRKSTRLNSSHANISYAVFCLKKKRISTHT